MARPKPLEGYALDRITPLRFVATALEKGGVTREALVDSYARRGLQVAGDVGRVSKEEGLTDDAAAYAFIIDGALATLGDDVITGDDGALSLARPLAEIKHQGKPIAPLVNDRLRLGDPFNRLTGGRFAENIPHTAQANDPSWHELRESMRAFGWLDHHPAIKDEVGVIIVGHRRLQVAQELGIDPKVVTMTFGTGDNADVRRLQYALGSNLGGKPLTKGDRAEMALYLYQDREWSMEKVAEALHVNVSTVSRDLGSFAAAKPDHPERGGRPRKKKLTLEQEDEVGDRRASGEKADMLASEYGVSRGTVYAAGERARGRQEVRSSALPAPPVPDSPPAAGTPCPHCHGTGVVDVSPASP